MVTDRLSLLDTRRRTALMVTAYHEAGHAVALLRFGRKIRRATIKPDAAWRGHVESFPSRQASRQSVVEDAVAAACGPAAQRRFAPRSEVRAGAKIDYLTIAESIELISQTAGGHLPLRTYVNREAAWHVATDWPAITAVAEALMAHETLTGKALIRIAEASDAEQAELVRKVQRHAGKQPNADEIEEVRKERRRRAKGISRRDIGELVLDEILDRARIGETSITIASLADALRTNARYRGVSGDLAAHKFSKLAKCEITTSGEVNAYTSPSRSRAVRLSRFNASPAASTMEKFHADK